MFKNNNKLGELFLFVSGLGILLSFPVVIATGSFAVWVTAKVFYGLGVFLFLFNR